MKRPFFRQSLLFTEIRSICEMLLDTQYSQEVVSHEQTRIF